MTSILSAIGSSAVLFAVIKGLFSFLVWYTRDEDPLFRKPIDKLWDELQIRSPFEILQAALRRSTQSSRLNMRNLKGFVQIGVAFVLVNLAALVVASSIWRCHLNNITSTPENRESCGSFLWIWIRYFWDSGSREYLSSCFLLMIFILLTISLLAFFGSRKLLQVAATTASSTYLFALVAFATGAVLVSSYASWWAYVALNPYIIWQGEPAPCSQGIEFLYAETLAQKLKLMTGRVNRYLQTYSIAKYGYSIYHVGIWLGAVSAVPIVLTIFVGVPLLAFRIMPNSARNVILKCLYLVSTDTKPVLTYVGTVAGAVSAVVIFMVSL